MNKLYILLHSIVNTLNRVVRDKVDTSQLNTEVNNALNTAKESGQFDGAPGKDGVSVTHEWNGTTLKVTSASGTTSADLKGEPGNSGVHFGSDEPKDDSSKVWVDLSSHGDVLDYVPSPDTAEVGQTIVVKAVDDSGKPTEWGATDLASSGGIEKLIDITTTGPTDVFQIPIDTEEMANKLLNASELHLYLYVPRDAEDTETNTSGNVSVGVLATGSYEAPFASFENVIPNPTLDYMKLSESIAKIFVDTFGGSMERNAIGMQYKYVVGGGESSSLYHATVDARGFKKDSYIFVNGTQNMAAGTRFVLGVRA